MNANHTIYITAEDYPKLKLLASALASRQNEGARDLLQELDRATVLDARAMSPDVVRLGSRVAIRDMDTNETEEYTVAMPDRASPENGVISVLAPIGTAVLGYSEGDTLEWKTPGGVRRIKLEKVQQPAIA